MDTLRQLVTALYTSLLHTHTHTHTHMHALVPSVKAFINHLVTAYNGGRYPSSEFPTSHPATLKCSTVSRLGLLTVARHVLHRKRRSSLLYPFVAAKTCLSAHSTLVHVAILKNYLKEFRLSILYVIINPLFLNIVEFLNEQLNLSHKIVH
jgi:hypothetical protein